MQIQSGDYSCFPNAHLDQLNEKIVFPHLRFPLVAVCDASHASQIPSKVARLINTYSASKCSFKMNVESWSQNGHGLN